MGRGVPYVVDGGTPSQVLTGGYLIPDPDGGYPIPGPDGGGTSSQVHTGGTPHSGLDWVAPVQDWMGFPSPCQDTDQHSGYLLHGGGVPLAFTQEDFLVSIFPDNLDVSVRLSWL